MPEGATNPYGGGGYSSDDTGYPSHESNPYGQYQFGAGLLDLIGSIGAAEASIEYQNTIFALTKAQVLADVVMRQRGVQRERESRRLSSGQALRGVRRDARRAAGLAAVSSAASGLGGQSVQDLISVAMGDLGRFEARDERQQRTEDQAAIDALEAIRLTGESTLLSAYPPPIYKPSFLGGLISLGADQAANSSQ